MKSTMAFLFEHWYPVLTLLVSAATLAVVWRYTRITASIERAAQEQAEAAQRPVIVLKIVLREDSMDEAMERISQKHVPQGAEFAVTGRYGHLVVKNIGTGPALNLSFDFFPVASKPGGPGRYARRIPYISPGVDLESPISSSLVEEDCKFTAAYESVSGKKYLEAIAQPSVKQS